MSLAQLAFLTHTFSLPVMDLIRRYYAVNNLTAATHRLEFIYSRTPTTHPPNALRAFLTSTAAFRALVQGEEEGFPDDMCVALARDHALMLEFVTALITLHRDEKDARHGLDCAWHVHRRTAPCAVQPTEVWEAE